MTVSPAGTFLRGVEIFELHSGSHAARPPETTCVASLDSFLRDRYAGQRAAIAVLDASRRRALSAVAAGGADEAADRLAASVYAGDALAGLAVEGLLTSSDVHEAAGILALGSTDGSLSAALLELYLRVVANAVLGTLPPLFAGETVLRLLVTFGLVSEASLWTRPQPNRLVPTIALGDDEPSRRVRLEARLALSGSPAVGRRRRSLLRGVPVVRWGRPDAALVVRVVPEHRATASAFICEAAAALSPILERALLLERGTEREQTLVKGSERRLTRLGFDLHDGPIQEVLMLAADARRLRDELSQTLPAERSEHAARELDDMTARLVDLDRELRELAHSLESRSAVTRPIEEVLHREVDAFRSRTGIAATLHIDGTAAFLGAAQRVALFRAAQESLSNAREHSGAKKVSVELRCRHAWTELRVADDGVGFEVEAGLTSAAKRGRLGIIGISERVRMLGGTFRLDSSPGGPTVMMVSLPRWEPLDPAAE